MQQTPISTPTSSPKPTQKSEELFIQSVDQSQGQEKTGTMSTSGGNKEVKDLTKSSSETDAVLQELKNMKEELADLKNQQKIANTATASVHATLQENKNKIDGVNKTLESRKVVETVTLEKEKQKEKVDLKKNLNSDQTAEVKKKNLENNLKDALKETITKGVETLAQKEKAVDNEKVAYSEETLNKDVKTFLESRMQRIVSELQSDDGLTKAELAEILGADSEDLDEEVADFAKNILFSELQTYVGTKVEKGSLLEGIIQSQMKNFDAGLTVYVDKVRGRFPNKMALTIICSFAGWTLSGTEPVVKFLADNIDVPGWDDTFGGQGRSIWVFLIILPTIIGFVCDLVYHFKLAPKQEKVFIPKEKLA